MDNPSSPLPVAIVVPWFGHDLKGGAEQQAWQIATRLATLGHSVEVLTTCCQSFFDDWSSNHLPEGVVREAGLTIHRFPVKEINRSIFDDLNRELLERPHDSFLPGISPVGHERAAVWTEQNINSPLLECYLSRHKTSYQAFIFLPYLYGITLRGLPLVAERAWLQPCLHDEPYAYLPDVASLFYQARGLLFISAGEMQLAARLYGPMVFAKGEVAGAGIELDNLTDDHYTDLPASLIDRRFLLCLGRRDPEKGVDHLIGAFRTFRQFRSTTDLHLVLAGPGDKCYTDIERGILDLGLVSEREKVALLQSCLTLCQPSTNESFSRVLFEAWKCSKPVIVHRDCLATAMAVQAAQGGWTAGTEDQWVAHIAYIESSATMELDAVGAKGRHYATEFANWGKIIGRYERLLELPTSPFPSLRAIHQLLPSLAYGDAISNEAIQIRDWLRKAGYRSDIFAQHVDFRVRDQCRLYESGVILESDGLIYHHSIGSEVTLAAVAHSGPKCLVYHNITPAEFFKPYRPELARLLRHGREELWNLARSFPISVGDSTYNVEELALNGFVSPGVLPLAIDPKQWSTVPDEAVMSQLSDGKHNVLFVGRYAPNKCQHHLVEAFANYLMLDPDARLILVGNGEPLDPYVQYLQQCIDYYGIREFTIMPGHINQAQLHAYYRTAHLFWSMSEHEGFCVPLIEAMWFDIPVLAFRSSAIPETMAEAGILFNHKNDLILLAGLALKLITDASLRDAVIAKQRLHRVSFLPNAIATQFFKLVSLLRE